MDPISFDVSGVVATFAAVAAAATLIGVAKIGPAGVMTGFRWVLAAIIK